MPAAWSNTSRVAGVSSADVNSFASLTTRATSRFSLVPQFGKVLKVSSENMPGEMHDLFLRYKELKKKIKAIPVSKGESQSIAGLGA